MSFHMALARFCIIRPMRYNVFPIGVSPENWRFFNL